MLYLHRGFGLASGVSVIDPLLSRLQNDGMIKVLLVVEEYSEMTALESALKKVGFSVVAVSSEFVLSQQILSFNPDVVIGSGRGPRLTSVSIGKRLKEMPRWTGHTLLAFPPGFKPAAPDLIKIRMDGFFDMPAEPARVIPILARVLGLDEKPMIERLRNLLVSDGGYVDPEATERKSPQFDLKNENVHVSGGVKTEQDKGFAIPNSPEIKTSFDLEQPLESDKTTDAFLAPDVSVIEQELKSLVGEGEVAKPATGVIPKNALANAQTEKSSNLNPIDNSPWTNQIEQANQKAKKRIEKAREALKGVKISAQSTVTRQKTRKVQKELVLEWDETELKNQDKLRQQFTRFLFKKKI